MYVVRQADAGAPFICMEDLSDSSTPDMMTGLNEKQFGEVWRILQKRFGIFQLVDVIADVQAWSIVNRAKWADNKDFDLDLAKFYGFVFRTNIRRKSTSDAQKLRKSYENFRLAIKENEILKRVWNDAFGDELEKSLDEFELTGSTTISVKKPHNFPDAELILKFDTVTAQSYFPDVEVPSVLLHGDCHPYNTMYEGDTMRALIDWQVYPSVDDHVVQTCRAGNPFVDLIRMMTSAPTDTARLEWWPRMFDRWHARITEKLGNEHKMKMNKQDLWKLYEVRACFEFHAPQQISFYYNATAAAPGASQIAMLKDGMVKGFIADIHVSQYMGVFSRMMRDGLEIKRRYGLK